MPHKNLVVRLIVPLLILLTAVIQLAPAFGQNTDDIKRELDFNFDWKFKLLDDVVTEFNTPLDDSDWRDIRLPHDWSVEASFDETLEGCTGYLPGGVAWYQKHFATPEGSDEQKVFVLFDGVYNNAQFWLNGQRLGENPYGYSPVHFDLTEHLKRDGSENVLSVYVDHSRYADGRWYTGSGIYRNVKLIVLNEQHIPIWGTFITTPEVSAEQATVHVETKVRNDSDESPRMRLLTDIFDHDDNKVASVEQSVLLEGNSEQTIEQDLKVSNPQLWAPEHPTLYRAVTTLEQDGTNLDQISTNVGIRSLRFDAKEGFFLNEKPYLVKGVCLHHAGGLVGAAVPEGVWRRRLQNLKDGGCNGIRLAHNPFSEEFLDLCDEMGFLVQNEFFDEWDYAKDKRKNYHDRHDDYITRGYVEHFREWSKSDLTRTMLRDRNHPCVFQWSIGNEIEWTYLHYRYVTGFWKDPNDPQNSGAYWDSAPIHTPEELRQRYEQSEKGEFILAETAQRLNDWVKELDTTRPTTANLVVPHVSMVSGYADAVDLVGFSYRNIEIGWSNKHFPDKHVTINECPGTWDDWKHVLEWPGVFSIYMWTGIDYMGESDNKWPQKAWPGDMLDIAGFPVSGWNYFKSIWVDQPHLSIETKPMADSQFKEDEFGGPPISKNNGAYKWDRSNMHWNYEPGEMIVVEVCSNHSAVELFLNGRSLGSRSMSECPDRIFRWAVPFEAGTLAAKAGFAGSELVAEVKTTSKPVGIQLTTDKATLSADGYDVAHVVAQLIDKDGSPVTSSDTKIKFAVDGDAKVLGVDNGSNTSVQDYQSNQLTTHQGRALLILQSKRNAASISVTASADDLSSGSVAIGIK